MSEHSPLGRDTDYPDKYAPDLLLPIARADARQAMGIASEQPFSGVDVWNAWELTWLGTGGRPEVATAAIRVPADTPNLIESKSLKLYLNSFAMSELASLRQVEGLLEKDLSAATSGPVEVRLARVTATESQQTSRLPGVCIDGMDVDCDTWDVNPDFLQSYSDRIVREDLYSHVLRSLCPVTGQPDAGSLLLSYRGPKIDREALLRYIVSFRQHNDFHEACVERIFVDLLDRCGVEDLSVCAYYQRRGGIDINPFRSNFEAPPRSLRLWRQ